MPQFDASGIFPQVFWSLVTFLIFYLVITYFFLPAIYSLLRLRTLKKTECRTQSNYILNNSLESNSSFLSYFLDYSKVNNSTLVSVLNKKYIEDIYLNSDSSIIDIKFNFCQKIVTILVDEKSLNNNI